jgi:hypothetical protein
MVEEARLSSICIEDTSDQAQQERLAMAEQVSPSIDQSVTASK